MVAAYRAVARAGTLTARARLSLYADPAEDARRWIAFSRCRAETAAEPGLSAGAVKIFLDGVIEAGTASLLEPYCRSPASARPRRSPARPAELHRRARSTALVTRLDREGFQVHMHAIGDRAVRQGLDAVAARRPRQRRTRRRASHRPPRAGRSGRPRRASRALGVVANMQPLWAYADAYITRAHRAAARRRRGRVALSVRLAGSRRARAGRRQRLVGDVGEPARMRFRWQ